MQYFLLSNIGNGNDPALCWLTKPSKGFFRQDYRLVMGERVDGAFPEDAHLIMDPDVKGMKLSSVVANSCSYLVCHRDMQLVIASRCRNEIEFLPITIRNHRGKPASRDYVIVNVIGTVDCFDERESVIEREDGVVVGIEKMVIDAKKVPPGFHLFRPRDSAHELIISLELLKALAEKKFTNVLFDEITVVNQ